MTPRNFGDIMINNVFEMNNLLDFYGRLLSDKQRRAAEMYYMYDYSLNEIAEELEISKQAVSDNLKRAENNLRDYEKKLKLIENYKKRKDKNRELILLVEKLEDKKDHLNHNTLEKIKAILNEEVY